MSWKVAPLRTATQHSAEQPLWVISARSVMSVTSPVFPRSLPNWSAEITAILVLGLFPHSSDRDRLSAWRLQGGGVWEGGSSLRDLAAQSRGGSQRFAAELVALRADLIFGNGTLVELILMGGTDTLSTGPDLAYEAHSHFR